jgi:hypothetical protein
MPGALNFVVVPFMPDGGNRPCGLRTKEYTRPLELPTLCDELFRCHVREES